MREIRWDNKMRWEYMRGENKMRRKETKQDEKTRWDKAWCGEDIRWEKKRGKKVQIIITEHNWSKHFLNHMAVITNILFQFFNIWLMKKRHERSNSGVNDALTKSVLKGFLSLTNIQ